MFYSNEKAFWIHQKRFKIRSVQKVLKIILYSDRMGIFEISWNIEIDILVN